ncbi:ABC transporter ATP-binding protein [Ectobacillus sp. JY-23]|uniref:ABC transporter ATP-binding protein n=1 Tax=Ectobacillus sp. JY-23 TaxID=2933872 RepID=UPI001FF3E3F4|nr:ABC transporter ATP-binding protein [Ectobacillus sp. JY-23]UOY92930.1 ABC transporter ATP-binding protein [Ectobacillus sp. JY-23]
MIRFENVTKCFPNKTSAVTNVNFQVEQGECFVLIGPSGCGKTTTMKMMNRLLEPSQGSIYMQGRNIQDYTIHELRWNIGYVLQQIALFPHMTVAENIAIVPELRKWNKNKIHKRVDELLDMIGLSPSSYRERKPIELSGGQQQRVGVARALAGNPDIILMDEPFSALDPISREQLRQDLKSLQKRIQKTIVFVTHDIEEALMLGDRICLMRNGEIEQLGTPEELLMRPNTEFVQMFMGINRHTVYDLQEVFLPWNGETNPISIKASLQELYHRLENQQAVPVEQNGNIVGVVTDRTIVSYFAKGAKM